MTDKLQLPVESWEIEKLIPYEANAKKHPPEQVEKLANSIRAFGFNQPIVVWTNGEIIAGHGRRLAALHLGLKRVPVIVRSDLSKLQADALRLADNRVTSTEYDQAGVMAELARINQELAEEMSFEMQDLGFDEKELDFATEDLAMMADDAFTDDIAEAVQAQVERNEEAVAATDDIAAPVTDALGFKRVTIAESREIRDLMGKLKDKFGTDSVPALLEALRRSAA